MARRVDLSQPAPFDVRSARAGIAWPKWRRTFEYYLSASGVTTDGQKRALLLHCAGPEVQELYETLIDEEEPKYESTMKALSTYFEPRKNVVFERHTFRQAAQTGDETVDEYCTRLRVLAASCEYGEHTDEHIRDQIVDKCTSSALRRRLLRTENLKLEDLLAMARAGESADRQAAVMEGATSDVNVIRGGRPTRGGDRQPPSPSMNASPICDNCGILGHRPRDRVCPALHRECHVCRRVGHFARVCRAQQRSGGPGPAPINQLADSDDVGAEKYGDDIAAHREDNNFMAFGDDDDVMFSVGEIGSALPKTSLIVNDVRINMLVDSGSTVDLIDERTLRLMRGRCPSLRLTPSRARVYTYGSRCPLPLRGQFFAKVSTGSTSTMARFVVVRGNNGCILGQRTATMLHLLSMERRPGSTRQEKRLDERSAWTIVQRRRRRRQKSQR